MRLLPWRTVLGAVVHKRELGSQKVDVVAGVCIGGCQRGQDSHDAHKQASAAEGRHGDELQRLRWRVEDSSRCWRRKKHRLNSQGWRRQHQPAPGTYRGSVPGAKQGRHRIRRWSGATPKSPNNPQPRPVVRLVQRPISSGLAGTRRVTKHVVTISV